MEGRLALEDRRRPAGWLYKFMAEPRWQAFHRARGNEDSLLLKSSLSVTE